MKENFRNINAWFYIPGFNGYQINPYTREIKSMKMMYANPGHILKPRRKKDNVYELTDNDNKRILIPYEKLYDITFINKKEPIQKAMPGTTQLGSRNKAFTSNVNNKHNTVEIDIFQQTITSSMENRSSVNEKDQYIQLNILDHIEKDDLHAPILFYDD